MGLLRDVIVLLMPAVACSAAAACGAAAGGIHATLGWSEEYGLRVREVPPYGTAGRVGLRRGDRITAIDGERVRSMNMKQAVKALRGDEGTEVRLEVRREGSLLRFVVTREAYRR